MAKKRKQRSLIFILEAAMAVLLFAGAFIVGGYIRGKEPGKKEGIYVSDHEGEIVEAVGKDGIAFPAITVDYDDLISGYRNILLVGVDARKQTASSGGSNADVIMIISINEAAGGIRIVSVLRDTLFRLVNPGRFYEGRLYDKANSQICYTDIKDMVSMINLNLDLNIQDYVIMNWEAAARAVDRLGGVDFTIEDPEVIKYLNGYLTEVNASTGIWSPQLTGTGNFRLTGTQAVALCRVRYAGIGDQGRTGNQREIIKRCLDKVKRMIVSEPGAVISAVSEAASGVSTDMGIMDIGNLVFMSGGLEIEETCTFPFDYVSGEYIGRVSELTGGVKDALVARDLKSNVEALHGFLFPEAAYAYRLPETVEKISEDIEWMSGVKVSDDL